MSTSCDIKDLIDSQQRAFKDCFETLFLPLSQKVDEQANIIYELRRSLEFTQNEFQETKNELLSSKSHITKLQELNHEQSTEISELKKQVSDIEDHSRRVNIRIDGIKETPKETWEQTHVKVKKLLSDTLQLPDVKIDHAHRVANPKSNNANSSKPRTIIARLEKFADRQLVLRNKTRLRNSDIYVNDDVSEYTNKIRKEKLPQLKSARQEGKIAYFNRGNLVIKNKLMKPTTLLHRETEQGNSTGGVSVTPPPGVTQLVERFTPGPATTENIAQMTQDNQPSPNESSEPDAINLHKEPTKRRSARNK